MLVDVVISLILFNKKILFNKIKLGLLRRFNICELFKNVYLFLFLENTFLNIFQFYLSLISSLKL